MIRFSIVIPLYNCENYIEECINSILSQSYPHYEIVVVNDGSTDLSRNKVSEIKDDRVRIIDKPNEGLLHARLTGVKESKNDYIVFLDADDKISNNTLSTLAEFFNSGYDCVMYKPKRFSQNKEYEEDNGVFNNGKEFTSEERNSLLRRLLTTGDINSISCKSFKKQLVSIEEMEKYPRIAIGEDGLFSLQIIKNYSKAVYLNKALYLYRINEESMTHKLKFSNYIDNVYRFELYYKTASEEFGNSEYETVVKEIDQLSCKMTISTLLNPQMEITTKGEYRDIIESVINTDFFISRIKNSIKRQNLFFKFVLKRISKKKVNQLLLIRRLIKIIKR